MRTHLGARVAPCRYSPAKRRTTHPLLTGGGGTERSPAADKNDAIVELLRAQQAELECIRTEFSESLRALKAELADINCVFSGRRKSHFTVEEVASMMARSEYMVRRWIGTGLLTAERLASGGPKGRLLIPRAELEKLIASAKGGAVPAAVVD